MTTTPFPRPLSTREREVLERMVSFTASDHPVRDEVATAEAVGRCDCGLCPSIVLSSAHLPDDAPREVIHGSHASGLVLLFIDGGHLSYLELAPLNDNPVLEFPPAEEVEPA